MNNSILRLGLIAAALLGAVAAQAQGAAPPVGTVPLGAADGVRADDGQDGAAAAQRRDPLAATFGEISYYILAAELAGRRGDMAAALEHYAIAARISDDPEVAGRGAGMALYLKDDAAALALAERWQTLAPDDPRARQTLALSLLRNGDAERAVEHLEFALEHGADGDQERYASLAALLEQAGDAQTALAALAALRERRPDSRYVHYYYALAALRVEDIDAALAGLRRALALDPDWDEALLLSTQIRIQNDADADAALAELATAVDARPEHRPLRLGYARLLVSADRIDDATAQFEALVEQDPDDADSLYALGLLAADAEQYDAAETYLRRLLDLGRRVDDVRFELGRVAERRDDLSVARDWYLQVEQGERYLRAQINAARATARLGDVAAAAERFAALREDNPDSAVMLFIAEADMLRAVKEYRRAFGLLDAALSDRPNDHELLYARALAAERVDRLDVLENDLRTIIAAEPDNGHALNALGYTLADRTDRYQEALGYLQRAVELLPDDAAVLDSMGWVKYRLGELQESLEWLRRAYALNDDPEIAAHLSEVLWQLGERDEAKKLWMDAFRDAPDSDYLLRYKSRFIIDD